MIRKFSTLTFILLSQHLALPALSAEEPGPKAKVAELLAAIREAKDSAEGSAARARASSTLAIAELSRRSLGTRWNELDEKGRETFVSLLRQVLEVHAFPKSSEFFKGLGVVYGEQEIDEDKALVRTTVMHPDEGQVDLDYKLKKDETGTWIIHEVLMDEVPMGANLRSQIRKLLKKEGYDEVLKRLRDKTREAEEEAEPE